MKTSAIFDALLANLLGATAAEAQVAAIHQQTEGWAIALQLAALAQLNAPAQEHGLAVAAMHYRSLKTFDFDSILMPWNYVMKRNERYAADFERTVALAKEKGVAIQTIKSIMRTFLP